MVKAIRDREIRERLKLDEPKRERVEQEKRLDISILIQQRRVDLEESQSIHWIYDQTRRKSSKQSKTLLWQVLSMKSNATSGTRNDGGGSSHAILLVNSEKLYIKGGGRPGWEISWLASGITEQEIPSFQWETGT